jgi:hypothetical protein
MTDRDVREPSDEELDASQPDVEGHGIDEEDEGEVGVLDVNFGC